MFKKSKEHPCQSLRNFVGICDVIVGLIQCFLYCVDFKKINWAFFKVTEVKGGQTVKNLGKIWNLKT